MVIWTALWWLLVQRCVFVQWLTSAWWPNCAAPLKICAVCAASFRWCVFLHMFMICLWFVYDVCWPGFQQTCQIIRTHNHHIVNIFLILYLSLQSSESCDSALIFTQNPCVTVKTVNALLISILWLCARSKMHTISTSECWHQTTTSESYRQKCCYFLIMSASRFPTFFLVAAPESKHVFCRYFHCDLRRCLRHCCCRPTWQVMPYLPQWLRNDLLSQGLRRCTDPREASGGLPQSVSSWPMSWDCLSNKQCIILQTNA
jgi:hypothetical protein